MTEKSQSQWDFGELFPAEPARKVLTVGELTTQIRRLLEKQVGQIWVTGEVTNFRAQSSGHLYFTLKDADSQLSCVLFRNEARESRALLEDGRKVVLQGDLTVYEPRGQYQLRVTAVELQGLGALQAAFEKLKQKLNAEGLFAAERKRPLPGYPHRIGIVTSPTGAAIRDVLHVIRRRDPSLGMVLAPCRVQGQGAGEEIAAAICVLNQFHRFHVQQRSGLQLDLILVTRGGGSLEDLWAFNEEVVARAIFESALPVVSAVGHEIDFTISDFVADLRAATPSAAAEIITEDVFSSREFVASANNRLSYLLRQRLTDFQFNSAQMMNRLARMHPRRRLNDSLQQLDDLQDSLSRCATRRVREQHQTWDGLRERLMRVRPVLRLVERRDRLTREQRQLRERARRRLADLKNRYATLAARLKLLGPEQVLARGYSITMDDASGKIIRSADTVKKGQRLRTKVKVGEIKSVAG